MDLHSLIVAELKSKFQIMFAEQNHFRTSEAAFAVNRRGRIVTWNRAAVTAFGIPKSTALNQHCWELLSGRDIFGNPFCCKRCPVHSAAFDNKPVNSFEINFTTGVQERKKFKVSTLMLLNGLGRNAFVHLCRPQKEASEDMVNGHAHGHVRGESLTPREVEVLAFLHKGMTITEIAKAMSVSLCTIRNHCQHIFSKLGVHSRFEAVAKGRKLQII